MNKAQLVADFKNMIGPAGKGSEVGDPGISVWFNDAYQIAVGAIIESIPDFYTRLSTSDSVINQNEYELPDDFEKVVMVSISFDGTNFVRALPLNNIGQALDIQQTANENFQQNTPYYYIYKNKIGFQPTFSATLTGNIKLWYSYMPAELSEDSDEPDLPRRLQGILKFWAYANYLDQNDEHAAAERMRQRFDVQLERIVSQLTDQQVDQQRTVEITNDDQGVYFNDYD